MGQERISLRWLGTAGFRLRYGGRELLLDPYISRPAGATPAIRVGVSDLRGASLILVSHGHFDHAMDVAELARASGADVYAPRKTCQRLEREGVLASRLFPNEEHPRFDWDGVQIQIIPSRHISFDLPVILQTLRRVVTGRVFFRLLPLLIGYPLGSNSEFLMEFSGYRVLFSGSGGGDRAALARLRPDCMLLPFAGRSDLATYYRRALEAIRPETVVLTHFDNFFPFFCVEYPVREFQDMMSRDLPWIRVIVPQPNKELLLP
jgi:L-ascorbate metabolism protein UlaG (beta-lactamase superfamily)